MNRQLARATWIVLLSVLPLDARGAADRVLRAEIEVNAPVSEVWKAWTTDAGIATFFAPAGRVDLRVDGTYDVWFNPAGKPGERGAEGMRILDVEPTKRFAFTWNAPPSIPAIRAKRTVVILDFAPNGPGTTRLRFTQLGWGDGPDWDTAYDYFDRAWAGFVLPALVYRFEKGPIDWTAPPELEPVAATIKLDLDRDEP
jgi:uncharacterized protein YndB with AHSA1/START domain